MPRSNGPRRALARRLSRTYPKMAALADRVDARHIARSPDALQPGHPGAVAAGWAMSRLVVSTILIPPLAAIVGSTAARRTYAVKKLIERYPSLLDAVCSGAPIDYPTRRVKRVPAADRYFISSDLHRSVAGTIDFPSHQHTRELYEVALDFYAAGDWGLIENGDVEDFWMVGGSTYGVVYDVFRLIGHALRGEAGRELLCALYREHLPRIVANNRPTYDRIEEGFHRRGRYWRLVGNHDDAYLEPEVVDALGAVHAGVTVEDFLVLDHDGTGVAVVTHGHHADSWNAPRQSGIGKLGTWFGSMLVDLPFAGNPGLPDIEETDRLLGGRLPARLTSINPVLGANAELYSLDETWLFEAFRRHHGVPRGTDLEAGPLLLLGHTHLPLSHPVDPDSLASWATYFNSGCAVFWECITGLEWDGTALTEGGDPAVRLVAWRFADRDEVGDDFDQINDPRVVGWVGDRAVIREVLDRVPPEDVLTVVDAGPGALMAPGAPNP